MCICLYIIHKWKITNVLSVMGMNCQSIKEVI